MVSVTSRKVVCTFFVVYTFFNTVLIVHGIEQISLGESLENFLATKFLTNLGRIRDITDKYCSVQIYSEDNNFSLNLRIIHEDLEPLELLSQNVVKYSAVRTPVVKHMSCCWSIVVPISQDNDIFPHGPGWGNSVYDQFVFISENETLLENALMKSKAIDKVANKYGMYPKITKKSGMLQAGYFVEPFVYTGGFKKSSDLPISSKFNNLNGRTLKSAIFQVSPLFVVVGEQSESGANQKYKFGGSHYKFSIEIGKKANCTIQYYGSNKLPLGKKLKNESWTGFIGEVTNGNADFSPFLGIALHRYKYLTYTTLTYRESMVFCVSSPEPLLHWHALVFPLSQTVWAFTMVSFFSSVLVFCAITLVKLARKSSFDVPVFLQEGIFLPFSLFLEQNSLIPNDFSSRIAALSLIWFTFVISMFYKSNLVGYLTFPEKLTIPKTFLELHEHKEFQIHLHTVGGLELVMFKTLPNPAFTGIVARLETTNKVEKCLKAATHPRTACIAWKNMMTTGMMKQLPSNPEIKELVLQTREPAFHADICAVLKKNTIYLEMMNRYAGYSRDCGLISKWIQEEMNFERQLAFENHRSNITSQGKSPSKALYSSSTDGVNVEADEDSQGSSSDKPLKMENLVAVAVSFAFGICLSIICFMVEQINNM